MKPSLQISGGLGAEADLTLELIIAQTFHTGMEATFPELPRDWQGHRHRARLRLGPTPLDAVRPWAWLCVDLG